MFEQTGEMIYVSRKIKGWTQEQLAEYIGVSSVAVSKWERNVNVPEVDMLCRLADVFDLSVDELLGRVDKQSAERKACSQAQLADLELGKKLLEYCEAARKYGWLAVWANAKKEQEDAFLVWTLEMLLNYKKKSIPLEKISVLLNNYAKKEAQKERCQMIVDVLMAMESGADAEFLKELVASHFGREVRGILIQHEEEKKIREEILRQYEQKLAVVDLLEEMSDYDNRTIQLILRRLDNETLIAALSGASGAVCRKFLENVSFRLLCFLHVDIGEYAGSREDIRQAQKRILEIPGKVNE